MSIGSYILYLPDVALEKIFSFLTYNEIAKTREVCKQFNHVCGNLLSRGFIQVAKRHSTIYKRMKTMLPRRESERRSHPLARHCDILSAVETRISMLNMTFSRYIEAGLCCFYPGKVIDEIVNVLNTIELLVPPPRTHELLQELRDISSMAMEHFEEFILPNLKAQMEHTSAISMLPTQPMKNNKYVFVKFSLANDVRKIKKQNKIYRDQIANMSNQIDKLNKREKSIFSKLKEHSVKLRESERKYNNQAQKIKEQEATIVDLRKHIDEWEQKFNDFAAEMRARDEFNDKPKEKSPTITNTITLGQNIKPRIAQVFGRSISNEIERKRKCSLHSDSAPIKFARSDSINITNNEQSALKDLVNVNLPKTDLKTNVTVELNRMQENLGFLKRNETFLSSVLETIIKNPIASIKSRKRKMSEDINLNDP